jgi:hypothetical protein
VEPPSDAAIQRRIEGVLAALGGTEEVDVDVRNGIVRLGGRADTLALREQASDLAGRVDGVVLVQSDVQVAADVRGRLGPAWHRVKGYLKGVLGFLPVLAVALVAFLAFAVLASVVGRWERPFRRLGLSVLGANVLNYERHRERRLSIPLDLAFSADLRQVPDLASGARQAVKEALLAARVAFPMREVTVHRAAAGATPGSLDDEDAQDGPEEALLEDHVREEQAEPGERDLLREGRSPLP